MTNIRPYYRDDYMNGNEPVLNIAVSFMAPPIPYRGADWSAHVDNWGADDSPYGHGATEDDAFYTLCDMLDELTLEDLGR